MSKRQKSHWRTAPKVVQQRQIEQTDLMRDLPVSFLKLPQAEQEQTLREIERIRKLEGLFNRKRR